MPIVMDKVMGSVDLVAQEAVSLAREKKDTVEFVFNGQTNWARPESCVYDITTIMLLRMQVAQLEAKK